MTRLYQVRHHQAIWETASFEVEADDDPAKAREWIEINLDRLMSEAGERDGLDVASGDTVEGVDSELEVAPSSPAAIALHVVTTRGVLNATEMDAEPTRAERRAHRRAKGAKPNASPRRRIRREP